MKDFASSISIAVTTKPRQCKVAAARRLAVRLYSMLRSMGFPRKGLNEVQIGSHLAIRLYVLKNMTVYKIYYSGVAVKPEVVFNSFKILVGERGLEPPTPWAKGTPGHRRPSLPPGQVVARPRLGGLHHRYDRAA
jgi:hypothetical protein